MRFVERRQAHQPVDASLGLEVAVGIGPIHPHGHTLESGFLPAQRVEHLGLESLLLGPAQVHAQQYLDKVLRVGAAGAGVDRHDGRAAVMRSRQNQLELHVGQLLLRSGYLGFDFAVQAMVLVGLGQLEQLQRVAGLAAQRLPAFYFGFEGR